MTFSDYIALGSILVSLCAVLVALRYRSLWLKAIEGQEPQ